MNNYSIYNIRGLSEAALEAAVLAAQKVVEPDEIKEIWMCPARNMIYVSIGEFPCVGVPHAFGAGAKATCQ